MPIQKPMRQSNLNKHGFTLIELLIVIVIIGIVSTAAIYSFGDFGASRQAKIAAEQFSAYIKLLQQQAILESSTFGIKINNQSTYDTYQLNARSQWQAMPINSFFHPHSFPDKVIVQLRSPKHSANFSKKPDIMITSSGEMTPFSLLFGTSSQPELVHVLGKHNGDILFQNSVKN